MIHNVRQGSEEWERLRRGRATASNFHRIITPAKLQLASGAKPYAIEKVAELLCVDSEKSAPTYWMDRGTELEPQAFDEFLRTIEPVTKVGFVTLDEYPYIGCSPDGLVSDNGILEIKCPKAETLIEWILEGELPQQYRLQVQGELWITGRTVAHFYGWHPEIEPFYLTVEPDEAVINAFNTCLPQFWEMVNAILAKVKRRPSVLLESKYEAEEIDL